MQVVSSVGDNIVSVPCPTGGSFNKIRSMDGISNLLTCCSTGRQIHVQIALSYVQREN